MTVTRSATAPVVVLLVVLSGCTGLAPPIEADATTSDRIGGIASPDGYGDPASDRLGWEGGYWHDEPIAITSADGLNETERAAVVNRTMARVEYLRGLEFRRSVPVSVLSRENFSRRARNRSVAAPRRQFDNVKFEALLMINESTDSIAVQGSNTATSVGGYYTPGNDRIVIVGDSASAFLLNEQTLAHELTHALQDQQFGLGQYDRRTRDGSNALSGLIEGDARYVAYLHQQRCDKQWDCLERPSGGGGGGGGGGLANYGAYLLTYQPYSDGPTFVRSLYREGGWSRVNRAYGEPPVSTEQTIHPERYPDDRPAIPRVRDRTSGSWERIDVENRPNYAVLGEAGVNAMLVYPGYETRGATQVIPLQHFINTEGGSLDRFDPLNYDHRYTEGIRGDRLVPYRNAGNETGYVWKLTFEDAAEARQFRRGYREVLAYRNASEVTGADGPGTVYRIPEDDPNGFGDAFRVVQDGDSVIITNAPRVRALERVHAPAA